MENQKHYRYTLFEFNFDRANEVIGYTHKKSTDLLSIFVKIRVPTEVCQRGGYEYRYT